MTAFSKSPYKTSVGASFPYVADGTPDDGAHGNGAYFHLEPGESYAGGGMWMPEKSRLDAFRRAIVDAPERVRSILEDPGLLEAFGPVQPHDTYKRVPPGYPADHPMADYLRYKDVVFGRRLSDDEIRSPDLPDLLADAWAAALPLFRFLATLRS